MFKGGEGVNAGAGEVDWIVNKDRFKYDEIFDKLGPMDGKISGAGKTHHHFQLKVLKYFLIHVIILQWPSRK